MNAVQHFSQLEAWKSGHQLALIVYEITLKFPNEEKFGLSSQMRRCAVSVTSNIAEGFGRFGKKEKVNFYSISVGSILELESQLMLVRDLGYVSATDFQHMLSRVEDTRRLTRALIKSIKDK